MFGPVTEILAMTDTVLEIRLSEPLGNLLQLLAQPEMAVLRNGRGTGPYRIYRPLPHSIVLRPVLPDTGEDIDEDALQRMERRVRGEEAPMAVARFAAGEADLVLGGTFNSYPLAQASGVNPRQIRRDAVPGLLGLVPARADGPIADRDVRRALAMAINRTAFVQRYAIPGWAATEAMLPAPIGTFIQAVPDWAALDRPARLDRARRLIGTSGITLRVALPDGPGGRLLFAQLAADWRQIGVRALRVGRNEAADLRLIDAVAQIPVATWYVSRFRCPGLPLCSQMATNTLSIMRRAKPEERPRLIAEADQSLADDQLYIPIAVPLRWSLVAPRLLGFADNGVAIHPLNRLEQAGN
jgi:peptide/nickel transport system substrate-binding protein